MAEGLTDTVSGSGVYRLLEHSAGRRLAHALCETVTVPECLLRGDLPDNRVSRGEIAQALNLLLFADLLERVPEAQLYVADRRRAGERLFLDHGAVRTVAGVAMGELPQGRAAFARFLEPLGFCEAGVYPLERLRMTGYAYCHRDHPEDIAQFFVSELDVRRFSGGFRDAAAEVLADSVDPLGAAGRQALDSLARNGALDFQSAANLLPQLRACFERQHPPPRLATYRRLLQESAEMAWIATEGSAYNHITDRVSDVEHFSEQQRRLQRPIKDAVEVAAFGSVRQTAYRASLRPRLMLDEGLPVLVQVPGSFIEFISRDRITVDGKPRLDLRFDAGNAQGIFRMTATDSR